MNLPKTKGGDMLKKVKNLKMTKVMLMTRSQNRKRLHWFRAQKPQQKIQSLAKISPLKATFGEMNILLSRAQ